MATIEQLLSGIQRDFVFRARPVALPPELRPEWRISLLLLTLRITGRSSKSSLKKLHVLNWVARHEVDRVQFLRVLSGDAAAETLMIRFDPALNRALEFAIAEKLITFERPTSGGLNVVLTSQGVESAALLDGIKDCFVSEKVFLKEVGKVSESTIENILNWGE